MNSGCYAEECKNRNNNKPKQSVNIELCQARIIHN